MNYKRTILINKHIFPKQTKHLKLLVRICLKRFKRFKIVLVPLYFSNLTLIFLNFIYSIVPYIFFLAFVLTLIAMA